MTIKKRTDRTYLPQEMAILKSVIMDVVNRQAEDTGLWFEAQHATESYLQQELRKLHRVIEEAFHALT